MLNWEYKKLGEICEFYRGLTYSKNDEVDFSKNAVLRSNNVDLISNKLDLSEIKYISENIKIDDSKKVKKGSLLICTANGSKIHLGKVALIDDDYDFAFGGFMGLIKPLESVYPSYLYYQMTSERYKKYIQSLSDGANINNLKFQDLGKFEIPIPPLEEQKRIVSILDRKFAMLETVKENAKTNLQNAKDLFQSQLTKAFSNTTWEKKRLGDVCSKIGSGATPKGGKDSYKSEGIHLVRSMNVHDNEFVYDELACLDDNQAYELRNVELQDKDVLFNITGASVCRCCVLPSDVLPARVNQHVSILRVKQDLLNPLFLCYSMIGPFHEELYKMACSGGSTRQAITKKQLEDFEVYVPSLKEQQLMIEKIDSLSAKVRQLEEIYTKQLANCDELKQAFLAKAFNGEL